ncbi:MAG TPA: helix-turn-helix domain-containing protein, partial [Polyangiaceae bacterium]
ASRRIDSKRARTALSRARQAAARARIPALAREVEAAACALAAPVARRTGAGHDESLPLADVERLLASKSLIVNALDRSAGAAGSFLSLARRPVLFALVRALAESFPDDASREVLIRRAFGFQRPNDSHRARLRVELARLRRMIGDFTRIEATPQGFVLVPRAREVVVLAPPVEGEHAAVAALLADGRAWSSSAVALALGTSQRTVQRVLLALETEGKVRSHGRARSRRWLAPAVSGFTPTLLLPGLHRVG